MTEVFISHAIEDAPLVSEWKHLLVNLCAKTVAVWYSSDLEAGGGMPGGKDWRSSLVERLARSGAVLVILTPTSVGRPWLYWEAGAAAGVDGDRLIFPIVYGLNITDVPSALSGYQIYDGCDRISVNRICAELCLAAGDTSAFTSTAFEAAFTKYSARVKDFLTSKKRSEELGVATQQIIEVHSGYLNSIDWHGKGCAHFITASDDATSSFLSFPDGSLINTVNTGHQLKSVRSVSKRLILFGVGAVGVCKWDPYERNGELTPIYEHPQLRVIDYSPSSELIASGGYNRQIQIHSWKSEQQSTLILFKESCSDSVRMVCWDRSGNQLAFSNGPTVHIWNLSCGSFSDVSSLYGHALGVVGGSWTVESKMLITGDHAGVLHYWQPLARKSIQRLDRYSSLGAIRCVEAHPYYLHICAIGGSNGFIEIIDSSTSTPQIRTLRIARFPAFINEISWHENGATLLVAYNDRVGVIPDVFVL